MPFNRIILLAGQWDTTAIVYNYLQEHFGVYKVIIEDPVSRIDFLRRRIKKLGLFTVFGQILFQAVIGKTMVIRSKKRIKEIINSHHLSTLPIPITNITKISSVNANECLHEIKSSDSDLIIVHGTRIISKKILGKITTPCINIHAGITPRYRGSHGAYWALINNDEKNCGVTVHLLDTGIDTGNILAQGKIPITSKDNFSTYGYLQLAEGLKLLGQIIIKLEQGEKPGVSNELNSALWYHPTLWQYLWKRFTIGVK
jgi:methionyl-tRNA formyltransferase